MARLITRFAAQLERSIRAQSLEAGFACSSRHGPPTHVCSNNTTGDLSLVISHLVDRVTATAPGGVPGAVEDFADVVVELRPPPSILLGESLVPLGSVVTCVCVCVCCARKLEPPIRAMQGVPSSANIRAIVLSTVIHGGSLGPSDSAYKGRGSCLLLGELT